MDVREITTEIYFFIDIDWSFINNYNSKEKETVKALLKNINDNIICAIPFLSMVPFLSSMMLSIEWKIYGLLKARIMNKMDNIKQKAHNEILIDNKR